MFPCSIGFTRQCLIASRPPNGVQKERPRLAPFGDAAGSDRISVDLHGSSSATKSEGTMQETSEKVEFSRNSCGNS